MNSVFAVGLEGVQKGLRGLHQNAQRIRDIGTENGPSNLGEVAAELVSQKENKLQVEASVAVLKTAKDVVGSLIDIRT